MIYSIRPTTKFQKDLKRIQKRGYSLDALTMIIKKLVADEPLPDSNKVHALKGNFAGCRECHISPDWLLIYEKVEYDLFLYLIRTGSHSDLFK